MRSATGTHMRTCGYRIFACLTVEMAASARAKIPLLADMPRDCGAEARSHDQVQLCPGKCYC